ncbi:hypothetical protein BpHYR1_032875 [Brachionus plicatilis]|uniref:Uncharacterized protein n=1 Tax=Brachionus plicatilis TaxID=10195 RepID=A0A3M7P7V6_BRAPC|nr:hypothetical protein BpHYR1_032875 [Brachionus plicatilis]
MFQTDHICSHIDTLFSSIDSKIVQTKTLLSSTSFELVCLASFEDTIDRKFQQSRHDMISKLKKYLNMSLSSGDRVIYVPKQNSIDCNNLLKLIDFSFSTNHWDLKLHNIHLFLHTSCLHENPWQQNYIQARPSVFFTPKKHKLILCKDIHLNLVENKFKRLEFEVVKNNHVVLVTESWNLKSYQTYQILSFNFYILLLIKDQYQSRLVLYYYDNEKNDILVVKQKTLDLKLKMHLMNRFEIIFLISDAFYRYIIFDFNLEFVEFFGQSISPSEPFYINETWTLLQLSFNKAFIYAYNYAMSMHFIKIISRFSGHTVRSIYFEKTPGFNQIRMDSSFRLLVKINENSLAYLDSSGNFLFNLKSSLSAKFKHIKLVSDKFIYFYNIPNVISCIA